LTFKQTLKPEYKFWEMSMHARTLRTDAQRTDFWRQNWPELPMEGPPTPMCGYWKMRIGESGKQRWAPVGIWLENGALMAAAGTSRDPEFLWTRCGRYPISYDDYHHAIEHGRFPGEVEAEAPRLNNYADDPNADYRDQMISLLARVEKFLKELPDPITDEGANALANFSALVGLSQKTAKTLLDEEIAGKKKEIAAQKEIWELPMKAATDLAGRIKKLLTPILVAKKERGEETRLGGQGTGVGRPRRIGLKEVWKARITDWDLAMQGFSEHPQVRELILTLANAAARSKELRTMPIEGVEFFVEEIAV
jgi:hypothetical protein